MADSVSTQGKQEEGEGDGNLSYKIKAGAFLTFAGGFGLFAGFAGALGQAKKQDPSGFDRYGYLSVL